MSSLTNLFPLFVLLCVFALIIVRRLGPLRLAIWQIMLGGAAVVVAAGVIPPGRALSAINADVMFFLFGMFVVGVALVESGYLQHISFDIFKRAKSTDGLVLLILFVMGAFSAILMNDTLAIIGTPLVLYFADRHRVEPKLLLLALCFAITTGSVMSPIGNPQNLLIAIGGRVENPFVTFAWYLAIPTVINLFLTYLVLKIFYRKAFHETPLVSLREDVTDWHLARLARASLVIVCCLIAIKAAAAFLYAGFDFKLTYIAVAAAAPILIFSPKRLVILRTVDWHTLIFFAALFVLMEGVWAGGAVQSAMDSAGRGVTSTEFILGAGVIVSQALSNVPFVAFYLPALVKADAPVSAMMALAAGSTIAGNLFILGAASNVIVIQNAERRGATLSFMEFARVGAIVTVISVIVYWAFFRLIS
ncbi:MAG: anion transporter [Deltaproteobacteria bacterium]|nr:anion transporter [Deltaproteobacteria bacterium]